jgi:hypothetical protein
MMGVVAVPTRVITSNLPDGHVELAVPLVATVPQRFKHAGADGGEALPEQRAKKNEPRATNEKRGGGGWFQGLKQKLQRTGSSKAAEEETTKVETEEKEKEAEEKEDDAEEEEGEEEEHEARDKLRVVVSFALVHQ